MKRDTGLTCSNWGRIHEGDKVEFCGHKGTVIFECGAFGISVEDGIDYSALQRFMNEHEECCGNDYSGCENDNFISLWEIYWNFCCIEDYLWMVKVIK